MMYWWLVTDPAGAFIYLELSLWFVATHIMIYQVGDIRLSFVWIIIYNPNLCFSLFLGLKCAYSLLISMVHLIVNVNFGDVDNFGSRFNIILLIHKWFFRIVNLGSGDIGWEINGICCLPIGLVASVSWNTQLALEWSDNTEILEPRCYNLYWISALLNLWEIALVSLQFVFFSPLGLEIWHTAISLNTSC